MKAEEVITADIVIVGAGVAGCISAIALAPFYKVLLIDKMAVAPERVGECLAPAAKRILKQLGLLHLLEELTAEKISAPHLRHMGTQSFWGSSQVHISDPLKNPDGFGWHLDRAAFENALRNAAEARGVTCIWPAVLHSSHYENHSWMLQLQSPADRPDTPLPVLKATFVIDASGRQAHFARKQGLQRIHSDKLVCCWATFPGKMKHQLSVISAAEFGWWYSAPLPDQQQLVALYTDSDLITHQTTRDATLFLNLMESDPQMATVMKGREKEMLFRGTVAANSSRLGLVAGQQWAAAGDAAISFDPLSSQGIFNAMATAMQLSALIRETRIIGRPSATVVRDFQNLYNGQINQIWAHYLRHKELFYVQEQRWSHAPFWKRREAAAVNY